MIFHANATVDIKRQQKTFADAEFTYTWEDVNTDCPAFITPTGGGQAGTILGRFPEATHRTEDAPRAPFQALHSGPLHSPAP